MTSFLLRIIDLGYFIFKPFIPLKTYRYAVCGGGNLVLDTILYFVVFHFVLNKQNLDLYFIVLSAHIASLFFVFPITFCIGFLLNRFIVFPESNLPMRTQFVRYFIAGMITLLISYLSMKILVDLIGFYPTPSKILTTVIAVLFSYMMQTKFSFKVQDVN
ncbi:MULTISPECIES: GtrA family protein [unclassified Aureispira]|uniref:GtrA family protein n=1 Tax=unclassified Aureispira TaxID=2649989 RepID=UPI000696D6ED|nr:MULTISPECIES: GtrA family protein [unclassified Aureispira]WMX17385.1 GtrA family protein [Aureispira sp. CCB-E]